MSYAVRDRLIEIALKETYSDGYMLHERDVMVRPSTPEGRAEIERELARLSQQC